MDSIAELLFELDTSREFEQYDLDATKYFKLFQREKSDKERLQKELDQLRQNKQETPLRQNPNQQTFRNLQNQTPQTDEIFGSSEILKNQTVSESSDTLQTFQREQIFQTPQPTTGSSEIPQSQDSSQIGQTKKTETTNRAQEPVVNREFGSQQEVLPPIKTKEQSLVKTILVPEKKRISLRKEEDKSLVNQTSTETKQMPDKKPFSWWKQEKEDKSLVNQASAEIKPTSEKKRFPWMKFLNWLAVIVAAGLWGYSLPFQLELHAFLGVAQAAAPIPSLIISIWSALGVLIGIFGTKVVSKGDNSREMEELRAFKRQFEQDNAHEPVNGHQNDLQQVDGEIQYGLQRLEQHLHNHPDAQEEIRRIRLEYRQKDWYRHSFLHQELYKRKVVVKYKMLVNMNRIRLSVPAGRPWWWTPGVVLVLSNEFQPVRFDEEKEEKMDAFVENNQLFLYKLSRNGLDCVCGYRQLKINSKMFELDLIYRPQDEFENVFQNSLFRWDSSQYQNRDLSAISSPLVPTNVFLWFKQ